MNSRDEDILNKIRRYCEEVQATHRFFQEDKALFCDSERGFIYRNAVTMAILQIGELAKNLSEDFLRTHTDIPWRLVIRTRDVYAHHYGSIEYELVWETSCEGINSLYASLNSEAQRRQKEHS